MHDQADELRRLVRQSAGQRSGRGSGNPKLVAVGSGKGGVGTTTIAVNLAVAAALAGRRVVLVDAALDGGNAATLCRVDTDYTIADVLAGTRSVHEVFAMGPVGIQVLPGPWIPEAETDVSGTAQERLIADLRNLGAHADLVILDTGSRISRTARRFWQTADGVLLVTTSDSVSVMNAYAAVKVMLGAGSRVPVQCAVNMAESAEVATEVAARIAGAARRFLGVDITAVGSVGRDAAVPAAAESRRPVVLHAPANPAAKAIAMLVAQITSPTTAIAGAAAESPQRRAVTA